MADVGLTMDDCPQWLRPRVEAAFARALGSLRLDGVAPDQGGLIARRVLLHGLTGRPDLNGLYGWTDRFFEEKGRYQITVENDDDEKVLLRSANLEVAEDHPSESKAQTLSKLFMTLVGGARDRVLSKRFTDWLDQTQKDVSDRNRTHSIAFRVTHSMDNEDRHKGRAAKLGLPTSEELLKDLALNELLVQFFADMNVYKPILAGQVACWWGNRTHARMQLAEWHETEGDYASAEPLYAIVVEQSRALSPHEAASFEDRGHDPNLERCNYLNNYALCLKRQKKYAPALELYRECLKIPGAPPHMRQNLALCEMRVNQPTVGHAAYVQPEAAAALRKTGESATSARDRMRELGNDAFRRSRFDEAIRMYSSALAVDDTAAPGEKAAPAERAKLLSNRAAAALGHDDYDAAATDAHAAIAVEPQNAKAWYRLGMAEWARRTHGEPCDAALDALRRASELEPESSLLGKKLAEVEAAQEKEAAEEGEDRELPPNAIDIGKRRFADTPLGRLDRLVGTEGVEAALRGNGWLRGVFEGAALWHRGLRDCQTYRSCGVDARTELTAQLPTGAAQAAADMGAGRVLFKMRAADVLRPMSDALFRCDEPDICCPLLAWLEGKRYNNVQTTHAINGLGQVLKHNRATVDIGLSSIDSPDAPPLSAEQLCRAVLALDLTQPEECKKAELTLRYGCVCIHMVQRMSHGQSSDAATAEVLFHTLSYLRRILTVRNLCVYNAHLALAGGARCAPLDAQISKLPMHNTHALFLEPGDPEASAKLMHAAVAALRESGEAGASLARVLDEPWPANTYYSNALHSTRLPNAAFEAGGFDLRWLESQQGLHSWLIWAADAYPRDPRLPMKIATRVYGLAAGGITERCVLLPSSQLEPVVPSFDDAHQLYRHAAELAEASLLGDAPQTAHLPVRYWWEAANSLAASNGSDSRGVELQGVRDLAARAEAAEKLLRGLFGDEHANQTSVAVRVVLEATKDRVGTQRLTRKEHRELTKDLLEGTPQSCRQAMEKYWAATSKSPSRVPKPVKGVPDVGPGWIPGAAVPKVGETDEDPVG